VPWDEGAAADLAADESGGLSVDAVARAAGGLSAEVSVVDRSAFESSADVLAAVFAADGSTAESCPTDFSAPATELSAADVPSAETSPADSCAAKLSLHDLSASDSSVEPAGPAEMSRDDGSAELSAIDVSAELLAVDSTDDDCFTFAIDARDAALVDVGPDARVCGDLVAVERDLLRLRVTSRSYHDHYSGWRRVTPGVGAKLSQFWRTNSLSQRADFELAPTC